MPTHILEIVRKTVASRHKITRLEMAAILEAYSRAGGSLTNGYVAGTVPPALNDLGHTPSDAEWDAIIRSLPEAYHRQAAHAWARIVQGVKVVSVGGHLRDGDVRFDEPGRMAPGQRATLCFASSDIRAATKDYLRDHCERLLLVDPATDLVDRARNHPDVDGRWNRYLYVSSLPVLEIEPLDHEETSFDRREEYDAYVRDYISAERRDVACAEAVRILEIRDPNDGIGGDPKTKARHQYVMHNGEVFVRRLPAESIGEVWRGETQPPPFRSARAVNRGAASPVGDYVLALLNY